MKFPNDIDGEVLENLYEEGMDFTKKQLVDFFVYIPNQTAGEQLAAIIEKEGFQCKVEQDEGLESWTCYCTKTMFLDYDHIMQIQAYLDEVSEEYNGYSDGWGVLVGDNE